MTRGEAKIPGLLREKPHISLSSGEFEAATKLVKTLNELKQQTGLSIEPLQSSHSSASEVDSENWNPYVRKELRRLKKLYTDLDFAGTLTGASRLHEDYPDCWRARLSMASCCVHMSKFSEAESILRDMLVRYSGNARALSYVYQNLGWRVSEKRDGKDTKSVDQAIDHYRASINYEPRFIVYTNLILNLLRLDKTQDAEALKRSPRLIRARLDE